MFASAQSAFKCAENASNRGPALPTWLTGLSSKNPFYHHISDIQHVDTAIKCSIFSIGWLFTMQYDSAKKPGKFGKFMDVANTVISPIAYKIPDFFLPRLLRLFTCLSMITWILVRKKPTFHQNYKVNNLEWRVFLAWNYANKLSSSYQGVLYMEKSWIKISPSLLWCRKSFFWAIKAWAYKYLPWQYRYIIHCI